MTDANGWSDYWQREGAGGEVFVDGDGGQHPALSEFWHKVFATLPESSRVIDIASGAGSVFSNIDDASRFVLTASDLSNEALAQLEQRLPHVRTREASAEQLPFADASFDYAVSQFGIEYAGPGAFSEALRVLRPGGELITLSHYQGGYIDTRNRDELDGANTAIDTDFIGHAIAVTQAVYATDDARFSQAAAGYQAAEQALAAQHDAHMHGVHAHLYAGFRELFTKRDQYAVEDITGWLEAMRGDLDKAASRLRVMTSAALSGDAIGEIRNNLGDTCSQFDAEAFSAPNNDKPIAWEIRIRKAG